MNKEMLDIKVYTSDVKDKLIYISQTHLMDDDAIIAISQDQINFLIQWLEEAKRSLQNGETS